MATRSAAVPAEVTAHTAVPCLVVAAWASPSVLRQQSRFVLVLTLDPFPMLGRLAQLLVAVIVVGVGVGLLSLMFATVLSGG